MSNKDKVVGFRVLPPIPDEPTFITVEVGTILLIDNLKLKGFKYLIAISDEELQEEISASLIKMDLDKHD